LPLLGDSYGNHAAVLLRSGVNGGLEMSSFGNFSG
jgi:hypothetical protein